MGGSTTAMENCDYYLFLIPSFAVVLLAIRQYWLRYHVDICMDMDYVVMCIIYRRI